MEQEHHKWLDDEEHADKCYGNEEPYSAKERRILITHWAGEAYTKLCGNEYDDFRKKLWLKTGCLISADGTNDDKIAPEGLQNYQVPTPHQYLEPAVQLSENNQVEFEEPLPSDTMVVDENNFLLDDQKLHERIDREEDCIVDSFVGRKIKALYENGWFVGKINYYNYYLKNTISYMRMIPKTTSRLTILVVLRFSYFNVRNFCGTKFRDFAMFWQFRESLEPRNI